MSCLLHTFPSCNICGYYICVDCTLLQSVANYTPLFISKIVLVLNSVQRSHMKYVLRSKNTTCTHFSIFLFCLFYSVSDGLPGSNSWIFPILIFQAITTGTCFATEKYVRIRGSTKYLTGNFSLLFPICFVKYDVDPSLRRLLFLHLIARI